jgi:hypothetical protein
MSINPLTFSVLVAGVVTYTLSKRLVAQVRVVAACVVMISLTALVLIVGNLRTAVPPANSFQTSTLPVLSGQGALVVPNSTPESGLAVDLLLQRTFEEDNNFLEEIVEKQKQDRKTMPTRVQNSSKPRIMGSAKDRMRLLRAELAVNTAGAGRSEPLMHKETVKRAQLVTHAETFKHVEAARTRQQ